MKSNIPKVITNTEQANGNPMRFNIALNTKVDVKYNRFEVLSLYYSNPSPYIRFTSTKHADKSLIIKNYKEFSTYKQLYIQAYIVPQEGDKITVQIFEVRNNTFSIDEDFNIEILGISTNYLN
ncbi:hypothetical protein [Rickettsia helvetica]|uniref:Uncharacterized protein n=1 Tax=Rickettsia helvetica TaxID=35789 RepID=A0ABM9NDL0_RICHE|nr:hypothetical protein [Rickettsia helvetica]MCZ6883930.1 hypothetical protein [Rickettsia endosymbiont of Ixodes ricinus]MCZ6896327.1 hypothetical protein [Rickettsia endosymbiont of Ixodes ricinus]